MENRIEILNELNAISPFMARIEKVNVFTVPEGYFEGLDEVIFRMVRSGEAGIFNDLTKQYDSEVPAGYFETLADTILSRIREDQNESAVHEIREMSPLLYSIQNENVFKVPAGYFETLADSIVSNTKPPQAKLITMRSFSNSFVKYAVAAMFTGAMALGVFRFTQRQESLLPGYVIEGSKLHNVDEELGKVSDEDIIKYLQSGGEGLDAQAVASSTINENELPSQDDYLTDEKALDKYFDNSKTNDLKN